MGKILLLIVGTHVAEGKNRDGLVGRGKRSVKVECDLRVVMAATVSLY